LRLQQESASGKIGFDGISLSSNPPSVNVRAESKPERLGSSKIVPHSLANFEIVDLKPRADDQKLPAKPPSDCAGLFVLW
jgi:hypothetical protein